MLGWDPQSPVPINDHGDTVPIVEALTSHFEFTKLTLPLLKNADIYFDNEELSERIQDESWAREYVINRDFIDLITDFPTIELQPENMYQILRNYHQESIRFLVVLWQRQMKCILPLVRFVIKHMDVREKVYARFILLRRIKPGDIVPIYLKKIRTSNFR